MKVARSLGIAVAFAAALIVGGCPQTKSVITVRITNNTDFQIDPGVEFGLSGGVADPLDSGVLDPGESVDFEIDCVDVDFVTATGSRQLGGAIDFEIDPLPFFDVTGTCGSLITFEFFGNGQDFDVTVDSDGDIIFP